MIRHVFQRRPRRRSVCRQAAAASLAHFHHFSVFAMNTDDTEAASSSSCRRRRHTSFEKRERLGLLEYFRFPSESFQSDSSITLKLNDNRLIIRKLNLIYRGLTIPFEYLFAAPAAVCFCCPPAPLFHFHERRIFIPPEKKTRPCVLGGYGGNSRSRSGYGDGHTRSLDKGKKLRSTHTCFF